MTQPDSEHAEHHVVPYGLYVRVWAALLALTAITVGASLLDMKHVTVLTAMVIAVSKALLVLLYFMHIRFESRVYVWMILAVLGAYGVFIGLTFADYWYR